MWHARSTMPPVLRRARVYVSRLVVRPDVWMVLVVFSRFSGPRGVERHDYPRPHLLWSGPGVFVRVSWKGTHVVASFRSQYTHTRSLQSTVLVPACHANTMMWSMCFVLTRWRDAPSFGHACRVSFGMGPHKQLNTTTKKKRLQDTYDRLVADKIAITLEEGRDVPPFRNLWSDHIWVGTAEVRV